jgi:hypothetical protein
MAEDPIKAVCHYAQALEAPRIWEAPRPQAPDTDRERSATCLMVRSRGAVSIECDCPTDFFITSPVLMLSLPIHSLARGGFRSRFNASGGVSL